MSWTPLLLSEDRGDGVKVIIGEGDLLLDGVDRDNDGERAKRRLTALVSCDGGVAVSDWAERVMSGRWGVVTGRELNGVENVVDGEEALIDDDDGQTVENDHQNCQTGSLFGNSHVSKHSGVPRHHIATYQHPPASQHKDSFSNGMHSGNVHMT